MVSAAPAPAPEAAGAGAVLPNNRKYLGSKHRLLDFLTQSVLSRVDEIDTFCDLFAGTGVVGYVFQGHARRIVANDLLYANFVVNRAFLASTRETVDPGKVEELVSGLQRLPPLRGYVFASYGGSYFTMENAARIDAVREGIDELFRRGRCTEQERFILLASLLLAADKAANTVGQYDAFLKHIDGGDPQDPRHLRDSNVLKPLELRLPAIDLDRGGRNQVFNEDANILVRRLAADVLYLDPPYNSRQYVDCYHVLENIMRWDKPRLYGKTRKFRREALKSRFSRKNEAVQALAELVADARAEHLFLSYNSEGLIPDAAIEEILGRKGKVEVFEREYSVFGNGAGSSRKRLLTERLFYCRVNGSPPGGKIRGGKVELFNERGESRGFYSVRNRLNDLTGKEWVYWTKSVINKQYPPDLQHRLRSRHGGQKPPELCADLIEVFTKRGERVLDPFAGVGGTLLGASLRGRQAVGVEINSQWVELYREVCRREGIAQQRMICGDSRRELPCLAAAGERFDFILTDVPYWRMDKVSKSTGKYKRVGEQQRERRASKLAAFNETVYCGKEQWLAEMKEIFRAGLPLLKARGYLAVFIGEMYHGGRYYFLSADLAAALEDLGLTPKANLIWYDVSKSLHVYGYQYEYIPSMIHQNVLIFRKEA